MRIAERISACRKNICMQKEYLPAERISACRKNICMQKEYLPAERISACRKNICMQKEYLPAELTSNTENSEYDLSEWWCPKWKANI
jgi:hypothetical protein